ncbi:MAG: hypothetical protein A3G01_02990 [Candidatus Kerfeldbacteria bacterium RIFCSPLOWO2_12_FULL_43_9]|nr:MAG: hypothetical protein A3G01_02990 [Candidatus Kerfeldbacteria bacterium RIFCSPLOWO2_12_FULL_43_9]
MFDYFFRSMALCIFSKFSIKEWYFLMALSVILMILFALPYVYASITAPSGTFFSGIHTLTPGDFPVYYSYLTQVNDGVIGMQNVFSGADDARWPFSSLWYLIGLFGKIFGMSPVFTFHVTRLVLIPVFVVVMYAIISYFFSSIVQRKFALLFLIFASGWGFFGSFFVQSYYDRGYFHWPMDLWVPESVTFLTLYHSPHLIVSFLSIVLSVFFMHLALRFQQFRWSVCAGFIAAFLFWFHPFHVLTVFAALGGYVLVRKFVLHSSLVRDGLHCVLFLFLTFPPLIYHWNFLREHPLVQQMSLQNTLPTTVWWLTLLSYGALIPLALTGIVVLVRKRAVSEPWLFVITWAVVHFVVLYAPVLWQRRLTAGFQVPLALLAFTGIVFVWQKFFASWWQRHKVYLYPVPLFIFLFIGIFGLSQAHVLAVDFRYWGNKDDARFYIPSDARSAFDWIRVNTPRDAVFVSDVLNSQLLAAFTGRRVYVAHPVQTREFENRLRLLQTFLSEPQQLSQKYYFLTQVAQAQYLLVTPVLFAQFRTRFNPLPSWLSLVYENASVHVYRVETDSIAPEE